MSWVKRLVALRPFQKTAGIVAAEYLRLVWKTTRFVVEPEDIYEQFERDAPVIIAMWHGQHFLMPFIRRAEDRAKVLVSRHRDGEINALAAERLGVGTIRGSGHHGGDFIGKGGVSAFKEMLGALQRGLQRRADRGRSQGRARRRARHRQARERVRPADLSDRDRDQPARRAHELGPHGDQSAVRPRRRRRRRTDPRAGGRRRRDARSRAARGRGGAQRGHRARLCHRRSAARGRRVVAERLPLTLHAYRLLTAAATPLAPVLVSHRLKHGKEHPDAPQRALRREHGRAAARPAGLGAWRQRRRIARGDPADRAHPREGLRRAVHVRHRHLGQSRRAAPAARAPSTSS